MTCVLMDTLDTYAVWDAITAAVPSLPWLPKLFTVMTDCWQSYYISFISMWHAVVACYIMGMGIQIVDDGDIILFCHSTLTFVTTVSRICHQSCMCLVYPCAAFFFLNVWLLLLLTFNIWKTNIVLHFYEDSCYSLLWSIALKSVDEFIFPKCDKPYT